MVKHWLVIFSWKYSLSLPKRTISALLSSSGAFTAVPFSLLIEGLNKLQPRYYSISSSSLVQKDKRVSQAVRIGGRVAVLLLLKSQEVVGGDTLDHVRGL
jgi:sulfite reductase alpha subunit-like flavoprotein